MLQSGKGAERCQPPGTFLPLPLHNRMWRASSFFQTLAHSHLCKARTRQGSFSRLQCREWWERGTGRTGETQSASVIEVLLSVAPDVQGQVSCPLHSEARGKQSTWNKDTHLLTDHLCASQSQRGVRTSQDPRVTLIRARRPVSLRERRPSRAGAELLLRAVLEITTPTAVQTAMNKEHCVPQPTSLQSTNRSPPLPDLKASSLNHRGLPTAPPLFKMLSCHVQDFLFLGCWRHPSQASTRTKNTRSFVNRSTLGNRLNAHVRNAGKGEIKMKWMVKGFSVSWVQRIRETWELMKQPCSATGTFGYLNTEPDCLWGFKSCLCHFLAVWNWMGCLPCPSHSFLTCNMGTITSTL